MPPRRRCPGAAFPALVAGALLLCLGQIQAIGSVPGQPLGRFKLTFYYLPEQRTPGPWPVYGPGCGEVLALADREFHDALSLEGVGRALDGRLLNFEERCTCALPSPRGSSACYVVLRQEDYPWGRGAFWQGRYFWLRPFRSLAIDPRQVRLGTAVYVPELAGQRLPDGAKSSGCFRAEDTGSGVVRRHLDLFVGRPDWYQWAQRNLPRRVTVYADSKRCALSVR